MEIVYIYILLGIVALGLAIAAASKGQWLASLLWTLVAFCDAGVIILKLVELKVIYG